MLGAGALGRPRGIVWGGRREEGSGWGKKKTKKKRKKKKEKKIKKNWNSWDDIEDPGPFKRLS